MPDTTRLTNVTVAGFGERCNLVWKSQVFVKDKTEILSRVKWSVVYFDKLVFVSDEQEFSLRGVESKKISIHPKRDLLKNVLGVNNA